MFGFFKKKLITVINFEFQKVEKSYVIKNNWENTLN